MSGNSSDQPHSKVRPVRVGAGTEVPSSPFLVDRPERIDVLLRHRLLPQPGGFEGLLAVEVLVDPRNLLAPKREYHRVGRGFQVDTSRVSAARQPYERNYEIAPRIEDAIKFPAQVRKRLGPRRQPRANIVVSAVYGVLRVDSAGTIRYPGAGSPSGNAGWSGRPFAEPPHQLDVLLRHRLLPTARRLREPPRGSGSNAMRRIFPPRKVTSCPNY